ncbi:MAG: hypothetical protein R6W70_09905, partial [bacterium]
MVKLNYFKIFFELFKNFQVSIFETFIPSELVWEHISEFTYLSVKAHLGGDFITARASVSILCILSSLGKEKLSEKDQKILFFELKKSKKYISEQKISISEAMAYFEELVKRFHLYPENSFDEKSKSCIMEDTQLRDDYYLRFLEVASEKALTIKSMLQVCGNMDNLKLLDDIGGTLHTFKSDCGFLGYKEPEMLAHKMELFINRLKKSESISNFDSFVKMLSALASLLSRSCRKNKEGKIVYAQIYMDAIDALIPGEKEEAVSAPYEDESYYKRSACKEVDSENKVLSSWISGLNRYTYQLAGETKKNLSVKTEINILPHEDFPVHKLDESVLHIIRNAVVHGIEKSEERVRKRKKPLGIIEISLRKKNNFYEFSVKDDGGGFSPDIIEECALDLKITEKKTKTFVLNHKKPLEQNKKSEFPLLSGQGQGLLTANNHIKSIG